MNLHCCIVDIMLTTNLKLPEDETGEPSLLLEAHKRKAIQDNLEAAV